MQCARRLQFVLLLSSLALASASAVAQVTLATVPAGNSPVGMAVNSLTNKSYVANSDDNTVTVIDGATNNTTTVAVGIYPSAVVVNPATNQIYVANSCGNDPSCVSLGTVTVIDGATNNTTTVNVGGFPDAVVVNSATNKIYVANYTGNTVTVIDGATNNTLTVNVGNLPYDVQVNSITNQIYAINNCGDDNNCNSAGTVSVIDGASNNVVATVSVGFYPDFAAVNSASNKIYVTNNCGNDVNCASVGTVTVIDGATHNTATVTTGASPYGVAVNAVTNQIYVANQCGDDVTCGSSSAGTVTVIDGVTNDTATINLGVDPSLVAVDSATNEIYVTNFCGSDLTCNSAGTVTVINGATNNTVPVAVGDGPEAVAVNATTDRIYVANWLDGTVSIVAGDTALQFVALPPCRVVDTRNPVGPLGGPPIQGGTYRSFPIPQSSCNIPATAAAYSLNATLVPDQGTTVGYLTLWPAGEYRPVISTMNSLDGRVKANAAVVPAGVSGGVSVYVTNTTDVVLDIDGYFALTSGTTLAFYPLPPCRVVDTRKSDFPPGLGPPQLSAGTPRDFPVLNSSCIPPGVNAGAYSFNFTVVPGGHQVGYLSVWPSGQTRPVVSTLNDQTGTIVANAAIVPAGTAGAISVYATDNTQLLVDIDGYFAPAGQGGLSLYPVAPCRALDTRHGQGAFSGELTVDVVNSPCGPPNQAQAYVFNATVIPVVSLGYLALWPDGQMQPVVSTLNATDGALTSNMAIVPAGSEGKIDAFAASGITNLLLDISSYFAP